MIARLDSIQRTATAPVVASTATPQVRHTDFALRQAPYTVTAAVDMPAPPDSAELTVGIALDSIPLGVRVTCAPPDGNGIRTASVAATMLRWASAKLGRVEQSPELCASPALVRSQTSRRWFRLAPLVAGVGRAVSANGAAGWAAFLGSGIITWV